MDNDKLFDDLCEIVDLIRAGKTADAEERCLEVRQVLLDEQIAAML